MKTADIHSQLQALISSCIDEGDYDPAEDYIKDPFCRRTMHTASLAINEIDTLRARVAELEESIRFNEDQRRMLFDASTKLEAERDSWKTEALAARPFIDMGCIEAWQPDEFHPGIPTHIAYKAARAANERGE